MSALYDFYYLPAVFAVLANVALAVSVIRNWNPLSATVLALALNLAFVDAAAAAVFAAGEEQVVSVVSVIEVFVILLPVTALAHSAVLSGRRLTRGLFVYVAGGAALVLAIAVVLGEQNPGWPVRGVQRMAWGYSPLLEEFAISLLSLLYGVCGALAIFWLVNRRSSFPFFRYRAIIFLYILWFASLFILLTPFAGYDIPPGLYAIDIMIPRLFVGYLRTTDMRPFGPVASRPSWYELLASVALGLEAGMAAEAYLPLDTRRPAFVVANTILMMTIAAVALHLLVYARCHSNVARDLAATNALTDLGLSRQEIRICSLIQEGYSKRDLLVFLNISEGTLRNHLSKIYSKTIDLIPVQSGSRGDKLQRLTVFLIKYAHAGETPSGRPRAQTE